MTLAAAAAVVAAVVAAVAVFAAEAVVAGQSGWQHWRQLVAGNPVQLWASKRFHWGSAQEHTEFRVVE